MGTNPLQGPLEGEGPENRNFFRPEMTMNKTQEHKITNVPVFLFCAWTC